MTFAGKVVVITGGATGYGRGIADRMKELDAKVVIVDISADMGSKAAANLGALFIKADVTKRQDWQRVLHDTLAAFGQVDVIVNNAGVCYDKQPSESLSETVLDLMLAVNLKAFFHSVGVIVPHLLSQKQEAVFVSVASTSGIRPRPGLTWYNASKSALITASDSLAVEYASRKIRFTTVCPVIGRTSMSSSMLSAEAGEEAFISTVPMGRMCTPQDVAHAVSYLASNQAAFITGVNIPVKWMVGDAFEMHQEVLVEVLLRHIKHLTPSMQLRREVGKQIAGILLSGLGSATGAGWTIGRCRSQVQGCGLKAEPHMLVFN